MPNIETIKVTVREVADAVALVAIELVGVMARDTREADARLEELAGRLIDYVAEMPEGAQRLLIGAIAETLIATEEGSSPPDLGLEVGEKSRSRFRSRLA